MTTRTPDPPASYRTERRVVVTPVFERLEAAARPRVLCLGGASSSKSHSMAQLIIQKLTTERDKVFGVTRKTFPALRMTAEALVLGLLRDYGHYPYGEHNKSDHTFRYGSNLIQFFSLDDPEKIKSFVANYIWMEEATDFTWADYLLLGMRLTRQTDDRPNQLYMTLNPIDEQHWINQKVVIPARPNVDIIHSTFRDNPLLSRAARRELDALVDLDPNYHRIYSRGEWGHLEHLIFPQWNEIEAMPQDCELHRYGIDFGFENPTVVLDLGFIGLDLYIDEVLYETHMTNANLIDFLKPLPRYETFADSSEPGRIAEMVQAGLQAHGAIKNVQFGIDTVKRYRLHITKRSVNVLREVKTYSRRVDKWGRVMEEPVKYRDHSPDALRYGVMGPGLEEETEVVVYDSMAQLGVNMDLE